MNKTMLGFAAALVAGALATPAWALEVQVLSSRPDMVTGGDALMRVTGTSSAPSVSVGGREATIAFETDAKGARIGLLTGLADGANQVVVRAGNEQATLTLTNHPINGTLFAGPQQQPFVCENEIHRLAPAKDASCAAPSVIEYFFRNEKGDWARFNPTGPRPADIGMTTTTEGNRVPMIVRVEKGVINRAAYAIALLHDPAAGPPPSPTRRTPGYNGKLIYSYGGGLFAGYHMGTVLGSMDAARGYVGGVQNQFHDTLIERGYAQAAASLNVFRITTNDVVSAETTAKVKERFIELYGPPIFTIGTGGSGGSMQQHLIANNYPGLLDGIFPRISYPDAVTFFWPLFDCDLMVNYFKKTELNWTEMQKDLVSGKKSYYYCPSNGVSYTNQNLRVDVACDPVVKDAVVNKEIAQPRCTYQDNLVNIFGTDPRTGFARNPWDNLGVQYGLAAFNEGAISFEQFVDLNSLIGGHDVNGRHAPRRTVGDSEALRIVYQTGRINDAGAGLAQIPIIDYRGYTDGSCSVAPCPPRDYKAVDIHDGYHSMTTRQRLIAANGHADNHVMYMAYETGDRGPNAPLSKMSIALLEPMDKWLTGIVNDTSSRSKIEKIRAHRPAELVDSCYTNNTARITDWKRCEQLFPMATNARIVAGAPRMDDVFKCQLKPLDARDYKQPLNAQQLAALQSVFPEGVCDWSKEAVGRAKLAGTWAVYSGNAQVRFLEGTR